MTGRRNDPPRGRRPPATAGAGTGSVTAARRAAYDALHEIGGHGGYSTIVLPGLLRDRDLPERDAAFVTELVFGTLRRRATLDAVIGACADRPLERADPQVTDVLRLGAYQVLYLRTPVHAAVSESVALARQVSGEGASRFTNAVLRKVAARDLGSWLAELMPADQVERLALLESYPAWIVRAFRDALRADCADGAEADSQLRSLLAAGNEPASPTLVARPGACTVAELIEAGGEPGRWSPYAVHWSGPLGDLAALRDGRAGVQDEASQLVVLAAARAEAGRPDQAWLDMCAGPGGKAALLAALGSERDQGAPALTAIELHEHRARLVKSAVRAIRAPVEVRTGDARELAASGQVYDRVLLDAPCTGLGVVRRRPEVRWRRTPGDVAVLSKLQRELLTAALDVTRPGGVVAYVTCSPHIAETDLVVADVLRGRDDVSLADARPLFDSVADLGSGPAVRLWAHRHGTDGMYFALLRRTGAH